MTNHPVVSGIGFSDDEDKIDNRLERKESVEQLKEHQTGIIKCEEDDEMMRIKWQR